MLIFVVLNGHHFVIQAVQQSFVLIPLQSAIPFDSPERLLTMTAGLISTGIQMALPVMCAIFLADLALGLLARVAPQVQVYFLGLPLKIGLGMIVFSMTFAIRPANPAGYLLQGWPAYAGVIGTVKNDV